MSQMNAQVTTALKGYMLDHGIAQADIARHLGRSESYVSARLNGKHDVSVDILGAVADVTRISPRALWVELSERMAR